MSMSNKQDVIKKPSKTTLHLAKGSNEQTIKQQLQQSMPSMDELKGKWQQQIGAAKIVWSKLTDDELLRTEGQEQKLAGLVQERYAMTRDAALDQVKKFTNRDFTNNKSCCAEPSAQQRL